MKLSQRRILYYGALDKKMKKFYEILETKNLKKDWEEFYEKNKGNYIHYMRIVNLFLKEHNLPKIDI